MPLAYHLYSLPDSSSDQSFVFTHPLKVPAGTVTVSRLLLAAPEQSVSELKMEPLLNLEPDAKGEEVFELFDKYNLRSLTVIDENKHPIGVITVDDVVSRLVKSQ